MRRNQVRLRRSHVRYRFKTTAQAAWTAGRRAAYLAAGVWLAQSLYGVWTQAAWLRVKEVRIDPKAPIVLASRLGVRPGDHFFGFSATGAAARLAREYPELARVNVRRRPGGVVAVSVDRRAPVARVAAADGGWRGIDEGGKIFSLAGGETPPETLPVLAGAGEGARAAPALKFLASLKELREPWAREILKLKVSEPHEATLYLREDVPVFWGDMAEGPETTARKAERLERVLDHEILSNGAEYVRFVSEDRLAAKPKKAEPPAKAGKPAKKTG